MPHPHGVVDAKRNSNRECISNGNGYSDCIAVSHTHGVAYGKPFCLAIPDVHSQTLKYVLQQHCRRQCNDTGRGKLPQHLL